MSRLNPTVYLEDTFYDLPSDQEVIKIDQGINTENVKQKNRSTYVDCTKKPEIKYHEKNYIDNETDLKIMKSITAETQTNEFELNCKEIAPVCHVCGGKMNIVDNKITCLDKDADEVAISKSLVDFCSPRRKQLLKENIRAIKNVALKLLDICKNPTESDVDNNARILQTLNRCLKTIRTNNPTICVPVIIRLDKRLTAGEAGLNNLIHKPSYSERSIQFSISRDFGDDVVDNIEQELQYKIIKNVGEKPLTNSSPQESLIDLTGEKVSFYDRKNKKVYSQSPGISNQKLSNEKCNGREYVKKDLKFKEYEDLLPSSLSLPPVRQRAKDPMKLAMNLNATEKENHPIFNIGMCGCAISFCITDLVCS